MKKQLILIVFLISQSVWAQPLFNQFLTRVNSLGNPADKATVVDSFINYHKNIRIPIAEGNYGIFIYKGSGSVVAVAGDQNSWSPQSLTNLNGTSLWYLTREFENNARLDYKYVINGSNWILDPLNPNTCPGGFGANSEFSMPGYIQPTDIIKTPNIPYGLLSAITIKSSLLAATFNLQIYLPAGYTPGVKYPVAYFNDGQEYVGLANAANILDNGIHEKRIQPVIGVFIRPNNRNDEYAYTKRFTYANFVVKELVPFIDSLYSTVKSPEGRAIIGTSFGANSAAIISFNNDSVFGKAGLHSPAFWPNNEEVASMIKTSPKKNLVLYSVWGTYEGVGYMYAVADSLTKKGYAFDYKIFPEGHSWGLWRANTGKTLSYLFPYPTSVENVTVLPQNFSIGSYPNPFNPSTTLSVELLEKSEISLSVYSISGEKILTVYNGELTAGNHNFDISFNHLSTGVYFAVAQVNGTILSHKMLFIK